MKKLVNHTEQLADDVDVVLEIVDLGSVSEDTQKFFVGFEQEDPYLYRN